MVVGRLAAGFKVLEMHPEMGATLAGLRDHRLEPLPLALQRADLAVDPDDRVDEDRATLVGVTRLPEVPPVVGSRLLVLEELPDLREGEAGVVPQPTDEPQ